jgi:hypothetical protein
MTLKISKLVYPILFLLVCLFSIPSVAFCNQLEDITEKRIGVMMRTIGHELLNCTGDSESRVLPIEKIDGQYKISFESEFGIDPDDVASIINPIVHKTQIASHYIVLIKQCETQEVLHSFEIQNTAHPISITCGGRKLPNVCYNLFVTLVDQINYLADLLEPNNTPSQNTEEESPLKSSLFILPLLFVIGFIGYFLKKNNPTDLDPNIITMGSTYFNKKNSTLSCQNKTIELSHKESELLRVLHSSVNQPIEREVILQKVWGDEGDYVGRTLDVFISKLRKKLDSDNTVKIVNIRGVGYKLVVNQ